MSQQDSFFSYRPRCPRPPEHLIEAALRALPEALCNHARPISGHQDTYVETLHAVSVYLSDSGQNWMAAEWAAFEAIEAGLLMIDEHQKQETRDGWLWVRTAPAMWDFWRKSEVEPTANVPRAEHKPVKQLTNWGEILSALNMPMSDENREKIKSLNQRIDGPIPNPGKGGQPIVEHEKLIAWWNHLSVLQMEKQNQRKGALLTAAEQHAYGKSGAVAPGVSGGVKRRRTKPKDTKT